jgi:hypothetical protein
MHALAVMVRPCWVPMPVAASSSPLSLGFLVGMGGALHLPPVVTIDTSSDGSALHAVAAEPSAERVSRGGWIGKKRHGRCDGRKT